jgi:Secretion system C-terminal sorting domain
LATNTTSSYVAFPTGINEIADNIKVEVFPNPFDNVATILVDGIAGPYDFDLVDITGRHVKKLLNLTSGRFELMRDNLAPGVYVYAIYQQNRTLCYGKLVIE